VIGSLGHSLPAWRMPLGGYLPCLVIHQLCLAMVTRSSSELSLGSAAAETKLNCRSRTKSITPRTLWQRCTTDLPSFASLLPSAKARICLDLDLFFSEDLGRIVRGAEAVRLLGIGVDHGVIGLSPDDAIDTRDPDWEQNALEACREHVAHNSRTSWRLQQKLMNRLVKFGGAPACPIVGYIVPEEARTYNDWLKDESLTAMLNEGLAILKRTLNGEAVAEFFNKNNMPVGPYCRRKKWDGRMALRLYRNDLLGGMASGSFLSER
jgi:hypothetical protein